jgi:DNA-binding transcriptional ArsR family regulator
MSNSDELKRLRFPCECVSGAVGGYSDPWADITKKKLLPNGTKEDILNLVAREPKTISQLAEALDLSPPSVYTHINDMMKSELLRESQEWEKKYPTERYYEPNFPVFKAAECAEFRGLCDEMAQQVFALFERKRSKIERAFNRTELRSQGWEFSDVTQCLYANMQRGARTLLEQRGLLSPREKHANGAQWIFWAEEPEANGRKDRATSKKSKDRAKRAARPVNAKPA